MHKANCPNCAAPLPPQSAVCAHCGAPRIEPAAREWKSRMMWLGHPMIHIAFGAGADGQPLVARGIIAIGQRASGGIAVGIIATGIVAIGLVAIGVFSLGIVAIGLGAACGVNAIAPLAVGVVAFGWNAHGLLTFGKHLLAAAATAR